MPNKITYSEPKSYFNAGMQKAAKEWEKEQKAKEKEAAKKKGK